MRVDLNCDLGEVSIVNAIEHDAPIMPHVTSVNIACGCHAGDPSVMRKTVRLAIEHAVSIGAHPGFRDLLGFGRRALQVSPAEAEDLVLYQLGALTGIVRAEGARLAHVKLHGALYTMASTERLIADAVAKAVATFDAGLILFGLSGSCLLDAGRVFGLKVASEVFADRAYECNGALVPRSTSGAVFEDKSIIVERVVGMVTAGNVTAFNGGQVPVTADTVCIHGDTPGAAELAWSIRVGLEAAGVDVAAFGARD